MQRSASRRISPKSPWEPDPLGRELAPRAPHGRRHGRPKTPGPWRGSAVARRRRRSCPPPRRGWRRDRTTAAMIVARGDPDGERASPTTIGCRAPTVAPPGGSEGHHGSARMFLQSRCSCRGWAVGCWRGRPRGRRRAGRVARLLPQGTASEAARTWRQRSRARARGEIAIDTQPRYHQPSPLARVEDASSIK